MQEMADQKKEGGKDMLQLLNEVSGAFQPGILTALVGVSGAGKTTLMDVLAGRKTGALSNSLTLTRQRPDCQCLCWQGHPYACLAVRQVVSSYAATTCSDMPPNTRHCECL